MIAADMTAIPPPPDGFWVRDAGHFPDPVTRLFAVLFPPALDAATPTYRHYGSYLARTDFAFFGGYGYASVQLAPAAEHYERKAAAVRTFETRAWREDLASWDDVVRPASIDEHLALGIDVTALDDDALAHHVDRCIAHYRAMSRQHHRFNVAATLPLADFAAHVTQWTGRPPTEALALMEGASPVSSGREPSFVAAVDAVRRGGDPTAEVAAWVAQAGPRLAHGFDFVNPTAAEIPGLLDRALRAAVSAPPPDGTRWRDLAADLRRHVPPAERAAFDDLLDEARLVWHLRDERGVYSDAWAAGLLRLAVLEAGRRLAARGLLERAEHLLECDPGLLTQAVHQGVVDGDMLAAAAAERIAAAGLDAPPTLGDPALALTPPDGWPARMAAALAAARTFTFVPPGRDDGSESIRGTAASPGQAEGRVCVVRDGIDLANVEPGDVLVMRATSEAVCVVMPLVAAVVTDEGGLLSHAAIVAREVGVPAVVGCGNATTSLRDGMRVRVDGGMGAVEVIGGPG